MKPLPAGALLAALLSSAPDAGAIYRCEQQGRISYSDQRCEAGARETVQRAPSAATTTARNAAPKPAPQDSRDQPGLQRERAEVARLQALREQRERQDRQIRDLAARGAAARERKCRALSLQMKWHDEDQRAAPIDKAGKARTKLRRTTEKYEAECR